MNHYELIDSGSGQKLERFADITLARPCPQAVWRPATPHLWNNADASFARENAQRWQFAKELPPFWTVEVGGVQFKVAPTEFGHLGIFPEHAKLWIAMRPMIEPSMRVLNLFAYSGGVTMAAAQAGAQVCHLDASKGMVDWARENAALNHLEKAPIRWIVDDAMKFLKREVKRSSLYEGIVLDPPTFGRGIKGEVFKIESELLPLLELCKQVLSSNRRFLILSCHTPGFTPTVLNQVTSQLFGKEHLETGEMALESPHRFLIPSGCYAIKTF